MDRSFELWAFGTLPRVSRLESCKFIRKCESFVPIVLIMLIDLEFTTDPDPHLTVLVLTDQFLIWFAGFQSANQAGSLRPLGHGQ